MILDVAPFCSLWDLGTLEQIENSYTLDDINCFTRQDQNNPFKSNSKKVLLIAQEINAITSFMTWLCMLVSIATIWSINQ